MILATFLAGISTAQQSFLGPAQDYVQRLSKQSGIPISLGENLRSRIVLVEPRLARPEEVLPVLAASLGATVSKTENGLAINRNSDTQKSLRAHTVQIRALWIQKQLNRITTLRHSFLEGPIPQSVGQILEDQIARRDPKHPNQVDYSSTLPLTPAEGLLLDLVSRIKVSALAQIPAGKAVIYETSPSPFTVALPNATDIIRKYNRTAQRWLADQSSSKARSAASALRIPLAALGFLPGTVDRLRLKALASENGLSLTLEGFDRLDHLIASSWLEAGPAEATVLTAQLMKQLENKPTTEWIELDEQVNSAIQIMRGQTPRAIPKWLLDPVANEPLNGFVRTAMTHLATRSPGNCVVMNLSDTLWLNTFLCIKGNRLNLSALDQTLQRWNPYEKLAIAGAVAWRPLDLESDERSFVERSTLKRFVKDYRAHTSSDLRTVSLFVRNCLKRLEGFSSEFDPLTLLWSHSVGYIDEGQPSIFGLSPQLVNLLGYLTDEQWAELRQGTAIPLTSLGMDSLVIPWLKEDPRMISDRSLPDRMHHPIDLLAEVGTDSLSIRIKTGTQPVIKMWPSTREETTAWNSLTELLPLLTLPKGSVDRTPGQVRVLITQKMFESLLTSFRFRVAQRETYHVQLNLTEHERIEAQGEGIARSQSPVLSIEQLPDSLRRHLWQIVSEEEVRTANALNEILQQAHSRPRVHTAPAPQRPS